MTTISQIKQTLFINEMYESEIHWSILDQLISEGYAKAVSKYEYGKGRLIAGTKKLDQELMGSSWRPQHSW